MSVTTDHLAMLVGAATALVSMLNDGDPSELLSHLMESDEGDHGQALLDAISHNSELLNVMAEVFVPNEESE